MIFVSEMKFIAVILFSFLLLTQTFSKWLLVMDYAVNKEYIAKNLCENRFRPTLRCQGKCQLMKKMAAEEAASGKSSSGRTIIKNSFSEVWFSDELISLTGVSCFLKKSYADFYPISKYSAPLSSPFHPPLV